MSDEKTTYRNIQNNVFVPCERTRRKTINKLMKMVKHDMLEIAGKDIGAVSMTNIIYDELSLELEGKR